MKIENNQEALQSTPANGLRCSQCDSSSMNIWSNGSGAWCGECGYASARYSSLPDTLASIEAALASYDESDNSGPIAYALEGPTRATTTTLFFDDNAVSGVTVVEDLDTQEVMVSFFDGEDYRELEEGSPVYEWAITQAAGDYSNAALTAIKAASYAEGMREALSYLSDIFEGVEDTDLWTDYMTPGEDSEEGSL